MRGYVYVLSNSAMPGLCKIGMSMRGGRHRAAEIDGTGVPAPFVVEFEMLTEDCDHVERVIHKDLDSLRVSRGREFFRIDVDEAIRKVVTRCCQDLEVGHPEFVDLSELAIAAHYSAMTREKVLDLVSSIPGPELRRAYTRVLIARRQARKERKLRLVSGGN